MNQKLLRILSFVMIGTAMVGALSSSPAITHALGSGSNGSGTSGGTSGSDTNINGTDLGGLKVDVFKSGNLLQIIAFFINAFLIFAGIVALIMALYGGFTYLTAGGDAAKASTGRTIIVNAIIGIIIIAIAYILVNYFVHLQGNVGGSDNGIPENPTF